MKFTDFQSKLNEMTKEPLSEAEEWVLGFDFELEYTSAEGRDIQKHLEKKFPPKKDESKQPEHK